MVLLRGFCWHFVISLFSLDCYDLLTGLSRVLLWCFIEWLLIRFYYVWIYWFMSCFITVFYLIVTHSLLLIMGLLVYFVFYYSPLSNNYSFGFIHYGFTDLSRFSMFLSIITHSVLLILGLLVYLESDNCRVPLFFVFFLWKKTFNKSKMFSTGFVHCPFFYTFFTRFIVSLMYYLFTTAFHHLRFYMSFCFFFSLTFFYVTVWRVVGLTWCQPPRPRGRRTTDNVPSPTWWGGRVWVGGKK